MNQKKIPASVFLLILSSILFFASCTSGNTVPENTSVLSLTDLEPVPELSPAEVVSIQLTALKESSSEDQGIALAYRFTSPRNKRLTGNVENFASMIRQGRYSPILYNDNFELGPVDERGALAVVAVRFNQSDDSSLGFLFVLTRQGGGEFENCWMTDGVLQVDLERISSVPRPVTVDL